MALKIHLKPDERLILGGTVVTNGNKSCSLSIENNVPVLRQKDILSQKEANTPCRRIYFVVQLMYVDEHNLVIHHNTYWTLVQDLLKAAPSMLGLIDQISEQILNGRYYQALKISRELINHEEEVLRSEYEFSRSVQHC